MVWALIRSSSQRIANFSSFRMIFLRARRKFSVLNVWTICSPRKGLRSCGTRMREYHREPRLKRYGLPIVSSLVMPDCDLELRRRYFSMLFQWFSEDLSPARFELTAPRLGIWCSILLSYGDRRCFNSVNQACRKRLTAGGNAQPRLPAPSAARVPARNGRHPGSR